MVGHLIYDILGHWNGSALSRNYKMSGKLTQEDLLFLGKSAENLVHLMCPGARSVAERGGSWGARVPLFVLLKDILADEQ